MFEFFHDKSVELNNYNFYQCYSEEEQRNVEISQAIEKLDGGEQFVFYDLSISKIEQQLISKLEVTDFNQSIINVLNSSDGIKLNQEIYKAIELMNSIQINSDETSILSKLITRIASAITGQSGAKYFELIIRTRDSYDDGCTFWHLDKNQAEIDNKNFDYQQNDYQEKRFIVPLKGAGTIYHKMNDTVRENFLKVAEEAPYYYGHVLDGCHLDDEISKLFDIKDAEVTKEGHGAVHIAGSRGAVHAAPKSSSNRLILLITDLEKRITYNLTR